MWVLRYLSIGHGKKPRETGDLWMTLRMGFVYQSKRAERSQNQKKGSPYGGAVEQSETESILSLLAPPLGELSSKARLKGTTLQENHVQAETGTKGRARSSKAVVIHWCCLRPPFGPSGHLPLRGEA